MFGLSRKKKTKTAAPCSVVVAAAGSSSRMEGEDKIMLPLGDAPVIVHTLRTLERAPLVAEIIVVTREDLIVPISDLCRDYGLSKVRKVVVGGQTRVESVRLGVLETDEKIPLIAIHDGARPLLTQAVLEEVIRAAEHCNAAAPAVPAKDTVKQAENGVVTDTLDRSRLFAVQTPQVFSADLIRAALHKALQDDAQITDDCSAVERLGMKVTLTRGEYENIKITTPSDLVVAQALLKWRESQ